MYRNLTLSVSLLAFLTAAAVRARSPQVHRLEATPATVVYGYYWSEAPPALRIASGDVIDVDTLTNTPEGLAKAGVPDDRIQTSLKEIVSQVTGDRRGPGGHILTGPVYVKGAEPGDVLFGSMGVAPAPEAGHVSQQSARASRRQSRQSRAGGGQHAVYPGLCPRRPVRGRRRPRRAG